jgi:hypothetical protein
MREKVQELFQSRTRRSEPNYRDWQTFLDLITYLFILNRDAPLYAIRRAAGNLKLVINTGDTLLASLATNAQDRLERKATVDTKALRAAQRQMGRFSTTMLDRGVNSTNSIPSLSIFNSQVGIAMDSMVEGVGSETSPAEAKVQMATDLSDFQELEEQLTTKTAILETALDDYLTMNLRGSGLSAVAARAERLISGIYDDAIIDTLALKDALEQLTAIQSTVNRLSILDTLDAVILSSTGQAAGEGTAALVDSGRSAPWDFDAVPANRVLDLAVDGAAPVAITLPAGTKALAETFAATDYTAVGFLPSGYGWNMGMVTAPLGNAVFYARVDDDPIELMFSVPTYYPTGLFPDFAVIDRDDVVTALTGLFPGAGVTVTLTGTNVVQMERNVVGEYRSIRFSGVDFALVPTGRGNPTGAMGLLDSGEHLATPVIRDSAYRGTSVETKECLDIITVAAVDANPQTFFSELISGGYGSLPATLDRIEIYKIQALGLDLTVESGNDQVYSAVYNFRGSDVAVGDLLKVNTQTFTVASVDENYLTLTTTPTFSGNYAFEVYPDTSVLQVGDMIGVTDAQRVFTSQHRISSITEGVVFLSTELFVGGPAYDPATFTIYRETLRLQSKKLDTSSSIQVDPGSTANAEMSYATSVVYGTVIEWEDSATDFTEEPILAQDILRIVSPSQDEIIRAVSANLTLTTEIYNNISSAYSIVNPDREAHDQFIQDLTTWRASNLDYWKQLDYRANPIIRDDPRQDIIDAYVSYISTIRGKYQELLGYIDAFTVRRIIDVDDCYKILKEGGFDRAFDLLGEGSFETFFALEAEEATYQGHFQLETETFVQQNLTPDQYVDPVEDEWDEYRRPDLPEPELGDFDE